MSRWFRWYDGTSEDGKFRVVARLSRVTVRDAIALWAFILEDASHLNHRGVCHRNEDYMASILDFEDGVVESILQAMESAGMISVGHGAITVCNWGKRQFEGDTDPTASDRQRRKRERDKTVSNANVTRDSRPPETEAESETKTEKKEGSLRSQSARATDGQFDRFKAAYPKREGSQPWKPARDSFGRRIRDGTDPEAIIAGASAYAKAMAGSEPRYVAQAVTWLNQERWKDDHHKPQVLKFPGGPHVQQPSRISAALDKLDDFIAGRSDEDDLLDLGPGDEQAVRH